MKLFCLLLFMFAGISLFSQEADQDIEKHIRQLSRLDQKPDKDEKDIAQMLELCKEMYSRDPGLVLDYLEKLKPVIEGKNYYSGWDDYCYLIQNVYSGKGEYMQAEKIIGEIYNRYAKKFTPQEEVSIRYNLAAIATNLGEIERSQAVIEEILPKAQTNFLKATLYSLRAFNYRNTGNYTRSMEDCLTAVDLYKSIEDWKNVAVTYDLLGQIYQQTGDYEKALHYTRQALALAKSSGNYISEMNLYVNMGALHRTLKQIDSALYFYDLGVALAKKHNRLLPVAQNLMNMANIYSSEWEDYEEAEKYYKQSLDICYASGIQYGIYINWLNLGNNYRLKKEYTQAKVALDSALVYSEKLKIPSEKASVQQGYYELYKDKNDFQKALSHYEKFNEIKQSLNLEEQKKEVAELQAKYDMAVKDKEIERINNENMKYRFRNRVLFLVIAATGFLIYFMSYRNKSLRNLYERNVELTKSSFVFDASEVTEQEEDSSPLRKVFDQLIAVMENEKLYKEPTLSVDMVTQKLQTNKKYLSNSIAVYTKENFNNFVNSYRIQEARRIILQNPSLSLNEVMYACGFNSRTPFYTAFQKNTGMSPQQFKDLSRSKKPKHTSEKQVA